MWKFCEALSPHPDTPPTEMPACVQRRTLTRLLVSASLVIAKPWKHPNVHKREDG